MSENEKLEVRLAACDEQITDLWAIVDETREKLIACKQSRDEWKRLAEILKHTQDARVMKAQEAVKRLAEILDNTGMNVYVDISTRLNNVDR